MLKRIATTAIFVILFGAIVAVARGYRVNIFTRKITSTGLIAVTSTPKSAKIYVNGELKDVTDTTLSLEPGTYSITVVKDGYFAWQKTVTLKGEIVQSLDAILYPINSSLTPLTNIGVVKAYKIGNSTDKFLIFTGAKLKNSTIPTLPVPTETEKTEYTPGIYTFDATKRTISFFQQLNKIASYSEFTQPFDPKNTEIILSPLGDQAIIFELDTKQQVNQDSQENLPLYPNYIIPKNYIKAYLVSLDTPNSPLEITDSVDTFVTTWTQTKEKNLTDYTQSQKLILGSFLKENTKILDIALDKKRILYESTASAKLEPVLTDKPVGVNQTPETRDTLANEIYIYDIKEDRNYRVDGPNSVFQAPILHPNSKNLIYKEKDSISISDFDAQNKQIVYSGPFDKQFLGITSDGRLIIITNLNPQLHEYADLYAVGIQ